jgi:DNA-binding PadR family transcriptional regulator
LEIDKLNNSKRDLPNVGTEMKKIGPFSIDIVVACFTYHSQKEEVGVPFSKLVGELEGAVSKSTILNALNTLSQWGVINTEFGELDSGRAGRIYSVSGESTSLIKETYEKYWDKIQSAIEEAKKQ